MTRAAQPVAGPRSARSVLVDAAVAAAFTVFSVLGTIGAASGDGAYTASAVPAPAFALIVVAGASLTLRRWAPLVALALCAAASALYLSLGYPYGPMLAATAITGYATGSALPVRRSLPAVGLAIGLVVLPFGLDDRASSGGTSHMGQWASAGAWASWTLTVWAIGVTVGTVRRSRAQSRLEHERELAQAERLRTAQDVHDIVGHGLAAITMQAGVALHVLDRSPARARELLEAIRSGGQQSLDELRATLALFRGSEDGDAELAPPAGLAQLPGLVQRMNDAGVEVRLRAEGTPTPLLATVDTAAYRIAQESLTNVLRHSDSLTADVLAEYDGDRLRLVITDRGSARAGPVVPGQGITGMQNRARAVQGEVVAGPAGAGGFRVEATLPTRPVR